MQLRFMIPFPALFVLDTIGPLSAQEARSVTSPDGRLRMTFTLQQGKNSQRETGALAYSVSFNGKSVVGEYALGLDLDPGPMLGADVRIERVESSSGVDDYGLRNTKTSKVQDASNAV